MRKVITIDGLAGTGKSSIAKGLATKLNWIHLNSGLLYRAVAYEALSNNVDTSSEELLCEIIKRNKPNLDIEKEKSEPFVKWGERKLSAELHTEDVSLTASKISQFLKVRQALLPAQQNAFPTSNLIAEGRDMGTVVFPDAHIKFFVEVSPEIKAKRRLSQLQEQKTSNINGLTLEKVQKNLEERDRKDAERATSPTIPAKDGVIVDNSTVTLTETIDKMYNIASSKGLI